MKIRSSYAVIFLTPIFFGIIGNACCPKTEVYYRSLTGIQLEHISYRSSSEYVKGDTTFIPISAYGVHITYNSDRINANVLKYQPGKLYATEPCIPSNYYFSEDIVSINVSSTNDFDEDHPKGSSLNDVFSYGNEPVSNSFESVMSDLNESAFFEDPQTTILLTDSTLTQRVHRFIVTYEMENGVLISDTTGLVYLED